MPPQYTIPEAAALLNLKPDSVYRYILRGKLIASDRSNRGLISHDEIERFQCERRNPGAQSGNTPSAETRAKIRAAKLTHHPLRDGPRAAEYRAKVSASKRALNAKGEHSPAWKGGRFTDRKGYIYVRAPDHPNANAVGYVFEHRLVMERVLGRLLAPDEVVHHINGIRDDNRPENLQVMTHVEHMRLHAKLRYQARKT